MRKGAYFGTEIYGSWWKRYRSAGFFARGNGELWLDDEGLHFLRLMTKGPLTISWNEMAGATAGRWHAGRWANGRPILKVGFVRHGRRLTAGSYLAKEWAAVEELAADLNEKIAGS